MPLIRPGLSRCALSTLSYCSIFPSIFLAIHHIVNATLLYCASTHSTAQDPWVPLTPGYKLPWLCSRGRADSGKPEEGGLQWWQQQLQWLGGAGPELGVQELNVIHGLPIRQHWVTEKCLAKGNLKKMPKKQTPLPLVFRFCNIIKVDFCISET